VTASAQRLAARIEKARSIEECHQIARDMLSLAKKAKKDRSSRRRDRTTRATDLKPTKEAAKAERSDRLALLRMRALDRRSDGACEFCETALATELHHLLSGGLRRHREELSTVAMICGECHRDYHRGDVQTLSQALEWAHRLGYWTTATAITKRLDKIGAVRIGLVVGSLCAGGTT
jgi:Fic family protein